VGSEGAGVGQGRAGKSKDRRARISRIAQIGASILIVAAIFVFVVPKFASYSTVWATIRRVGGGQLALLVGVTVLNITTYWPQMMAAMPGLTLAQAAVNNQATTSVANTVSGGGAIAVGIGYAMFRSWGFADADIALLTLATGVWNTFIKLGLPVVALAILAIEGGASGSLVAATFIGLAGLAVSITLLALVLWKERFARAIGSRAGIVASFFRKLVKKKPVKGWDEGAASFRKDTIGLVRRRWIALTIATVVSHLGLYVVLLVSLRVLGVSQAHVTWAEVLGVFALARLVSALPITPGGLGVVELSYIGGLVLAGGDHPRVVAAVLVFRALTFGLQIPLGPLAYLIWQRRSSWKRSTRGESVRRRRRAGSRKSGNRTPSKAPAGANAAS
jgi:uncharacterized membrane protein YbhN (UPF0104 family)